MDLQRYSLEHTRFLQVMIDKAEVTRQEANELVDAIYRQKGLQRFDAAKMPLFVKVINDKIGQFSLAIRSGRRERDGAAMLVLISIVSSDLNKLVVGGKFTRQELDYFKALIELIMTSNDPDEPGVASSVEALNIADSLKISKGTAKTYLESLEEMKFIEIKEGLIRFTLRSVIELEHYLSDQFGDVQTCCKLCSDMVVCGVACHHCQARFHIYCAAKYLASSESRGIAVKCLGCKRSWSERLIINLRDLMPACNHAEQANQAAMPAPSTQQTPRRKRKH